MSDQQDKRDRPPPLRDDLAPPRYSYQQHTGPGSRPESVASTPTSSNPPSAHLPPHHLNPHPHRPPAPTDRGRAAATAADSRPPPGSGLSSSYSTHSARHDPSGPPGPSGPPPPRSSMFGGPGYPFGSYLAEKRERERLREIERERELQRQGQQQGQKPPGPAGSGGSGSANSGSAPASSDLYSEKRERERLREIERERERERQQKAGPGGGRPDGPPGHSTSSTAAGAYARPVLSPTLSRREQPPLVSSGAKPPSVSASHPPSGTSAASAPRSSLPSFPSLGPRPMGSGYEPGRARSGSSASQTAKDVPPGHQRTLSSTSQPRESLTGLSSMGQTSPVKTTGPPGSAAARSGLFDGPPPLSQAGARDVPPPARSPVGGSATTSPVQSTREPPLPPGAASKPPGASGAGGSAATSHSARPPYSFSSTFASAYTSPYNSYGMGGGFLGSGGGSGGGGGFPFGGYGSAAERERREREREKERESQFERERQAHDRSKATEIERERQAIRERDQAEKERLARIARERQIQREREAARMHDAADHKSASVVHSGAVEGKAFQPPRQPYGDMYRPRPPAAHAAPAEPKYTRHIEVLNQPGAQPQPYPSDPPPVKAAPAPPASVASVPPPAPQRAAPPAATERQPPYQYTPKPDTREYTYTPRENKRPRMDTAVEEAAAVAAVATPAPAPRRAGGSRKRKKEEPKEEKKDLSALAVAVKTWPDVTSAPVQAYLKTVRDLQRVVARQVYAGSDWSLARTAFTQPEYEGSLVIVRISGAFLGQRWKVRGEPGWEEATSSGTDGATVGLEWGAHGRAREERRIWGTDVYTDDSDLGLVLIHAGWIRWGGPETRSDSDLVNVSVRIVPSLQRYYATERNGVITRGWGNGHDGASIVVEGVERVKVEQAIPPAMNKRAKRKLYMAELFRERQLLESLSPPPGDVEVDAGMLAEDILLPEELPQLKPPFVFDPVDEWRGPATLAIGILPYYVYAPEALQGYLELPLDGGPTLWTHNLEFSGSKEKYLIELEQADDGLVLNLRNASVESGDPSLATAWKPLRDGIDPAMVQWIKDGLTIQLEGDADEGWLCPAHVFRWFLRKDGPVSLSAWNDGTVSKAAKATEGDGDEPMDEDIATTDKAAVAPAVKVEDDKDVDVDGDVAMEEEPAPVPAATPAPVVTTRPASKSKSPAESTQPTRTSPRKAAAPLPARSASPVKAASPTKLASPVKAASPAKPASASPANAASPVKSASPAKPISPVRAASPVKASSPEQPALPIRAASPAPASPAPAADAATSPPKELQPQPEPEPEAEPAFKPEAEPEASPEREPTKLSPPTPTPQQPEEPTRAPSPPKESEPETLPNPQDAASSWRKEATEEELAEKAKVPQPWSTKPLDPVSATEPGSAPEPASESAKQLSPAHEPAPQRQEPEERGPAKAPSPRTTPAPDESTSEPAFTEQPAPAPEPETQEPEELAKALSPPNELPSGSSQQKELTPSLQRTKEEEAEAERKLNAPQSWYGQPLHRPDPAPEPELEPALPQGKGKEKASEPAPAADVSPAAAARAPLPVAKSLPPKPRPAVPSAGRPTIVDRYTPLPKRPAPEPDEGSEEGEIKE